MDASSRIEEITASDSGRAKAGVRHPPRGDVRLLRSWRPIRIAAAGIAAAGTAAVVVSVNGMMAGAGAAWWNVVIVAAGSILAGLLVGSYVGAPIGAEATVCDTRWPVLGLTGLVIATSTGQDTLATHLFSGAAPAVLAGVIQPAFALLALALLGWALRERLELERNAVTSSDDGDESGVCTTCRPLFPTKPGPSGNPHLESSRD
ncbi:MULTISPECIES: hypothetical protein [unclassified Arthrobacter]|uniref:hypothetical protein n=1 Tax=unclassified Arthrobacter TaxID=235627 RepID=UPI002E065D52|nr:MULTISPECIES: hypothetical protein [unclassified Arthrobacter]MEC5193369.1 hypothetical protein [Arthrobacter sp. MP_M4]MEC5204835.1 hypothetical protein [Arthrobacter sp. MP_M7]